MPGAPSVYFIVLLSVLSSIGHRGSKVVVSLSALQLGANSFTVGILAALCRARRDIVHRRVARARLPATDAAARRASRRERGAARSRPAQRRRSATHPDHERGDSYGDRAILLLPSGLRAVDRAFGFGH